jgi:hypothetical protein
MYYVAVPTNGEAIQNNYPNNYPNNLHDNTLTTLCQLLAKETIIQTIYMPTL